MKKEQKARDLRNKQKRGNNKKIKEKKEMKKISSSKKVELLLRYSKKQKLTKKDFKKIIGYADDKDMLVRCIVAELLVNFRNGKSKKILLKLAHDKNVMVRTEAYDSLSVFKSKKALRVLKNKIKKEKNELACAYAILSWTDIACLKNRNISQNISFIDEIIKYPRIQKSERCMLSCYYAQYRFGEEEYINNIISFLKSSNYQIRCSTVNMLWEFFTLNNQEKIKAALCELLVTEETNAVRSNTLELLEYMDNTK